MHVRVSTFEHCNHSCALYIIMQKTAVCNVRRNVRTYYTHTRIYNYRNPEMTAYVYNIICMQYIRIYNYIISKIICFSGMLALYIKKCTRNIDAKE